MRFSAVLAGFALSIGLTSPARAEEPEPEGEKTAGEKAPEKTTAARTPEAPAYPPPAARWGVIGAGLATSAFFYGAAAGMSYAFPDAPGAQDLRTPIIGPWKAIANNGCPADEPGCSKVWIVMRTVATAIGGLAQAGGIFVALEGAFMPTQYAPDAPTSVVPKKRREPSPDNEESPKPGDAPKPGDSPKPGDKNLFWMPTPMAVGERGVGVGVFGQF